MTCINCPIEITTMHLYPEGMHVSVLYRDRVSNFYFAWRLRLGALDLDFYTFLRIISRVARTTLGWHLGFPSA